MRRQRGMFLIEALIAILIFALGILGMVAMGGAAVNAQSDAQYRTEASSLAEAIAGKIALNVDRQNGDAALSASLESFEFNNQGANCRFSGGGANAAIRDLLDQAGNVAGATGPGLPGADNTRQQIIVTPEAFNRVTVTLCWQTASDNANNAWRRHSLVTYINRE